MYTVLHPVRQRARSHGQRVYASGPTYQVVYTTLVLPGVHHPSTTWCNQGSRAGSRAGSVFPERVLERVLERVDVPQGR